MGSALRLYLEFFGLDLSTAPLAQKILTLLIILVLGLAIYTVFSHLLRIKEFDSILRLVKRKNR
jgi:hypothetical protein